MITLRRWFRPPKVDDLRWRIVLVLMIVFLSVLIKVWAVTPFTSPNVLGDDVIYLDIARSLHENLTYPASIVFPKYPPLYPLLLSMALTEGSEYFGRIKVLNVLLSSLLLVATYILSDLFLEGRDPILGLVIASLLPYHFTYPQFLLSENLYYPLVIFSIACCVVVEERNTAGWSVLLGVAVALSCLTKFIAVLLIPLFMLFWFAGGPIAAPRAHRSFMKEASDKVRLFGYFAASFLICYSPWLAGSLSRGWEISDIFGFGVVSAKPQIASSSYPFDSIIALAQWLRLYLSYTFLMVGPCLGIILGAALFRPREFFATKGGRFFLLSAIVVLGLVVASAHHSWAAHYNYPLPRYLVGRYLMPIGVLVIVNAIIVFRFLRKGPPRPRALWMAVGISAGLILISYLGLLTDVLGFTHKGFLVNTDSGDLNIYRLTGVAGLGWVLAANMTLTLSANRDTRRPLLRTGLIMAMLVLVFNSVATYYIFAFRQTWMAHGEKLASVLTDAKMRGNKQVFVINNDVPDLSEDQLRATLEFRGLGKGDVVLVDADHISDSTLRYGAGALLTEKNLPVELQPRQITEYDVYGSLYRVYDLPIEIDTSVGIEILETTIQVPQVDLFRGSARFVVDAMSGRILDKVSPRYGTNINAWRFFRDVVLLQYLHIFPDRTLMLMIKGTNFSKGSVISWDENRLKTHYLSPHELWAELPYEFCIEGRDHTLTVRSSLGSLSFSSPVIRIPERKIR